MSMRTILVGVDFSPESEVAARQTLDLARARGAALVLAHVRAEVEVPVAPRPSWPVTTQVGEIYRTQLELIRERDRERMDELCARLSGQGVDVQARFLEGFPDEALIEAGRDLGADLIAVGTHGRTGLRWFFLGSVAQRVVRGSDRDVLVARGGGAEGGYRRILVATDFSASAVRALDQALALAAPGAQVDVVHFYQGAPRVEVYDAIRVALGVELGKAVADEVTERGRQLVADRAGSGAALEFHALADAPVPGILHWLERQPYDLAALGSHGRRGLQRFAIGSVAEAVVSRAPSSVLVARGA